MIQKQNTQQIQNKNQLEISELQFGSENKFQIFE